jgi:hypothetical protein
MKRWSFGVNLLGLVSAVLMLDSMFYPWWSFRWSFVEATKIYPYIVDGPGTEFIGYRRSTVMIILTVVLIVSILMCLVGSLLKGRKASILMGVSGALALLCAWRLLARITKVAAGFDLPPTGHGWGGLGSFAKVEVWTQVEPGLYIIVVAGVLAILAAFLHSKIRIGSV